LRISVFLSEEVVTEGEKYRIDLLVETKLKGKYVLIVIHVESQAQYQQNFNERMSIYFSRLYEKYRRKILPIVMILSVMNLTTIQWIFQTCRFYISII
jgi:hypothetical protein